MQFIKINTSNELLKLQLPEIISIDCETTGLNPDTCELLSIVIGTENVAFSIPAHLVSSLFFIKNKDLILQNFKYDFKVLRRYGIDLIEARFRDIMLMHHLIDENAEHNLDYQVQHAFNDDYKMLFWEKYKTYIDAPDNEKLEYECKDAIYTYRLYNLYQEKISHNLCNSVHELALELYRTEVNGVMIDLDLINKTKPEMLREINNLQTQLRPSVEWHCVRWELEKWGIEQAKRKTLKGKKGVPKPVFNFGSVDQLQWLLFTALKLPVLSKTKNGNPAVDYDALTDIKDRHPICEILQSYKGLKTLYQTFVNGILERQRDGKIYPEFNINGTHTGRISSSNPNLQNMPKDGPYRGFFIPSPGMCFFGADYAQLEVVIEANLTGDKNLSKIVVDNASKHDITAKELKIDRDLAKTLNFAMQYWCSAVKVKELMGCSMKEAEYVYNKYWEVYAGVKALKAITDKRVDEGLPIISPFGRERHLPSSFRTPYEMARAKRQAYNALIQGTGADITHRAFYTMASMLRATSDIKGRMLWPIHDEILGEINIQQVELGKDMLNEVMCEISGILGWKLPLSTKTYGPLDRWCKT